MGQTIEIFSKPFAVDWQSSDRRLIACRESQTCYELVSFDFLKSDDDEVLRRGLPNQIFKGCVTMPGRSGMICFTSSRPGSGCITMPKFLDGSFLARPFPPPGWEAVANLTCERAGSYRTPSEPPPKIQTAYQERLTRIADCLLGNGLLIDSNTYRPSEIEAFVGRYSRCQYLFLKDVVKCEVPDETKEYWKQQEQSNSLSATLAKLESVQQAGANGRALQPPTIDRTLLWHVQQQIQDKLDHKLRSAPVASQVFVSFCRERLTRAEMHRRNKNWSESTIKLRIKSLRKFLLNVA